MIKFQAIEQTSWIDLFECDPIGSVPEILKILGEKGETKREVKERLEHSTEDKKMKMKKRKKLESRFIWLSSFFFVFLVKCSERFMILQIRKQEGRC